MLSRQEPSGRSFRQSNTSWAAHVTARLLWAGFFMTGQAASEAKIRFAGLIVILKSFSVARACARVYGLSCPKPNTHHPSHIPRSNWVGIVGSRVAVAVVGIAVAVIWVAVPVVCWIAISIVCWIAIPIIRSSASCESSER